MRWLRELTPRVPFLRQGHLVDEEPSGYFNAATEEALKRWQQANGITRSPGLFGVPGRALYAKARGPDEPATHLEGAVFANAC